MAAKKPKAINIITLCIITIFILMIITSCSSGISLVSKTNQKEEVSSKNTDNTFKHNTGIPLVQSENTSNPETTYGISSLDLVNNEISKQYFPDLVQKLSKKESDKPLFNNADYPFKLFAIEPFEGGALLLAGFTMDQEYPHLYYMKEKKVLAETKEAEYFSLNYTVFKNHTISFGLMLDDDGLRSVKAIGTFANGEVIERTAEPVGNYMRGYILIADGQTWLSSIKFLDKNGGLVTDETSDEIGWNKSSYHWKRKPLGVWNVQRYTQFLEKPKYKYEQGRLLIRIGKSEQTQMNFFIDDADTGWQYFWRGNNNIKNQCEVKKTEEISIDNLPENANIYWVNIEKDKGGNNNIKDLLIKGNLHCPKTSGSYCLLIKVESFIYTLFVNVK